MKEIEKNKLSRADFLKQSTSIFGAVLVSGSIFSSCIEDRLSPPAIITSKKSIEWRMVTTWPPNFPIIGDSIKTFVDTVYKLSHGRLHIKVFNGGELIPPLEVFDAVSSGTAEIGSSASYYWAGKSSATQLFSAVPFGMNAQQLQAWIEFGGGYELWSELYAKFNLVPFYAGNTGMQMGGWFNKSIEKPEDLKGVKMRIPGLGGKVFERAGGTVVLSAGGEIYTNLERGVIDAAEWLGPFHDYLMGFHEIAKYYYSPGWHEPGSALEFIVNKSKYESLPEDLKLIIKVASAQSSFRTLSHFEKLNAEYLQKIVASKTVEIREFPNPVLKHLFQARESVLKDLAEENEFNARVYKSYSDFQTTQNKWADYSERLFYNSLSQSKKL